MTTILRTLALITGLATIPAIGQWVPYNHPGYTSIFSSCTGPSAIYMVSYPNGVIKSTDGGTVWNPANTGFLAVSNVQSVFYNGTVLFAGTDNGVYRSTDAGASWTLANTNLPASSSTNYVTKFFKFGTTTFAVFSGTIGAGVGGVWRTTDDGLSWFSGNAGLSSNMTVYQMAQFGSALWVATNVGLAYSVNSGVNWTNDAVSNFSCFAIQGTATRMVVISTFGYRYRNYTGGAWGTWSTATGGPSNPTGGELILFDGKYWAITGSSPSSVLRSTDNGATYSAYNTGLVGADVIAQYKFHAGGSTLYMGTLTKLYSHTGTTLGVADDLATAELPKPYPTLFVDVFNVDLSNMKSGGSLVLIDASGREVAQRNELPAAPVQFERGTLPSGSYRVLLMDPTTGTRRMLGTVIAQ